MAPIKPRDTSKRSEVGTASPAVIVLGIAAVLVATILVRVGLPIPGRVGALDEPRPDIAVPASAETTALPRPDRVIDPPGIEPETADVVTPSRTAAFGPAVEIMACALDEHGWPAATVRLVNLGSESTGFLVRVTFTDRSGELWGEGLALFPELPRGDTAIDVATSIDRGDPGVAPHCAVGQVTATS